MIDRRLLRDFDWAMLALTLAHRLRLNLAITLLACNISLPPMVPLLSTGHVESGALSTFVPNTRNGWPAGPVKLNWNEPFTIRTLLVMFKGPITNTLAGGSLVILPDS